MANIVKMRCVVRATIQPAPYESLAFEFEETVDVLPGDNANRVREQLQIRCRGAVEREVIEARREIAAAERRRSPRSTH